MRGTDESSGRDVRLETAKILRSLRRHHFLYFSGYEGNDDMDKFLGEVMKEKAHPAGKRQLLPISREPGVRVVYRNGQGNRRAVLLPDLRQGAVPVPVVRPERHQKGKS